MSFKLDKDQPIAVFDSGMGGISVLRELIKVMPQENFIYLGDSRNAPYGTKNPETVRMLTLTHAANFFNEGVKGLVVACNTATAAGVRQIRQEYPEIPVVGIEPAVKPAALSGEYPIVLVMATPVTIYQEKFQKLMGRFKDCARIIPLPCPGLMEFVERGELDSPALREHLKKLFAGFPVEHLDAVVLGCTHYPFLAPVISDMLGPEIRLYDGGPGTAREMKRRLGEAGLLRDAGETGHVTFRNTLPDPDKLLLCRKLLEIDL